ncbi:MAG: DUF4153 domain-containing protein [Mycobacteriales bacterium]|nr:DUF4173 domain-containing protein [Frankia sp.]
MTEADVDATAAETASLSDGAPSTAFLGAAVATAVLAALIVPGYPPGVGVTASLLLIGATLLSAVRSRLDLWGWCCAALVGVLAVMPTVRAAEWLIALDVLAVGALGSLALARARRGGDVLIGLVGVALRAPRGAMLLIVSAARAAGRPATARQLRPLVRGVLLSVIALGIFGPLFISADDAFADLTSRLLFPDWLFTLLPLRVFTFAAVLLAIAAGLAVAEAPVRLRAAMGGGSGSLLEWLLPVVVLDALFTAFVLVQLAVLFGGDDYVQRTTGLSYASYARQGFGQLLAVVVLTLVVIAVASRRVGAEPRARRQAQASLGVLCLLALVVLFSALHRLALYEDAFGLTRLRVLAHTLGLLVGVLLVLVVVAGARWQASWLPRAVVLSTAVTLVVLNLVNPDQLIARRAVNRAARGRQVDAAYLATLSADAIPQLLRLPPAIRACALPALDDVPDGGWPGANLARSKARRRLRRIGDMTGSGALESAQTGHLPGGHACSVVSHSSG